MDVSINNECLHIQILAAAFPDVKADIQYTNNTLARTQSLGTFQYSPRLKTLTGQKSSLLSFLNKARLSVEQETFLQSPPGIEAIHAPRNQEWTVELLLQHVNAMLFTPKYAPSWNQLPDYGPTIFDPFDL